MPLTWHNNPIFLLALLALIFMPLERRFAAQKSDVLIRPQFGSDIAYHLFTWSIIFSEFWLYSSKALNPYLAEFQVQLTKDFLSTLPIWLNILLGLIISTFADYWAHRLLHTKALWPVHVIHHSSQHVDWLAATRVHPFELVFLRACQTLPLWFLGFPLECFLINLLEWFVFGDFTHANLRFRLGPFANIIVNPNYHHWHHSKIREKEGDTNFGGSITLWDFVFGTYHRADGTRPTELGVENSLPSSFLGQLSYPIKTWLNPKNLA